MSGAGWLLTHPSDNCPDFKAPDGKPVMNMVLPGAEQVGAGMLLAVPPDGSPPDGPA